MLAEKGVGFVDCGVSGGVWGLENGYALMYGGSAEDVAKVQPVFDALKPEGEFGAVHAGSVGAGHFSKMVHNGIEYAVMQAYAEGWELLDEGRPRRQRPRGVPLLARGHGHPVLAARPARRGARRGPRAGKIRGYAEDSGEGRWTVEAGDRPRGRRRRRSPPRCYARFVSPPGRLPRDEGRRRDAQPVRRARRPGQPAPAPGGDAAAAEPSRDGPDAAVVRLAPAAARLPLLRRRRRPPRAGRRPPSSAATGRARPTWSRRSTTSRASPPTGSRATPRWSARAPSRR